MNETLHGDVIEKLKELETGMVQCVVTSPPYWGLRDYGTATWEGGDADCDHIETLNLKRDVSGGVSWGRDKGSRGEQPHTSASKKTYKDICKKCGSKRIDSQIGLEKTPEEYVENMVKVFREVKRVLKKDGTCFLNLGDSYNGSGGAGGDYNKGGLKDGQPKYKGRNISSLKPKDLVGIPWRVAFALQSDGWWLRQDIIWHKPNPMPESVTDRCTKSHEYIFLLTKSAKYYYDNDAIREDSVYPDDDRKSRTKDHQKYAGNGHNTVAFGSATYPKRNKRSVWTINTQPYKEAHFAVFPPKIPELCIKAGSKEGDTVLDPFFGSGTTGWVAQRLGRQWIGIELNEEYIKIANKRFAQRELFIAK